MNELQIFQNEEFGSIRTIERNGQIWFCGKDVALALGYTDTKKALMQHCKKDGVAFYPLIDSLGRKQDAKIISEPNLYRLVCNSKLKSAERFEKWVFEEVLPMIRRTGSYNSGTKSNNIEETSLIVAEVIKAIVPVITKTIIEAQQKPQVVTNNLNITYKRKKKSTKRFKVEEFPEEIQMVVIRLLQNGATFDSVAEYCCDEGYEISKMSICRYYHAFFL